MAAWLATALLVGGCSTNDHDRQVSTGDGSAGDGAGSCAYSRDYACWRCPGGVFGKRELYKVGCRTKNDCKVFCGPVQAGYEECYYRDPGPGGNAGPMCVDWPMPPRGTLAGCSRRSPIRGHEAYSCPFCLSVANSVSAARDPQGRCYTFSDTCIPRGFDYVSGPWCPSNGADGGVRTTDGTADR